MLKRFMFASLGILALTLAFHFGASTASSDGTCFDAVHIYGNRTTVASNGVVRYFAYGGLVAEKTLPRSGAVADVFTWDDAGGYFFIVAYADGDLWRTDPNFGPWQLLTEFCGFTSVEPSTWGQIKARAGGSRQ